MSNDFEQQWAVAMKKSTNKSKMSIGNRKKLILGKIELLKLELKKHIKEKNKPQIHDDYSALVSLRARLSALQILESQEEFGITDPDKQDIIVHNYVVDCYKLKNSLSNFL